jgi:hypothetical protein
MNSIAYNFSDFTWDSYRELLRLAKKEYSFENYSTWHSNEKFVIWRHDVDFSMHSALNLARIENCEGVKTTYFLLLHSEFYNLLEKEISDLVFNIIDLGHNIGLHFDSSFYNITDINEFEEKLVLERKILESIYGVDVHAFSFHNPSSYDLSLKNEQYGGMYNTYSHVFQNEISYCSDSNGYWRHKRLYDFLINKHSCMQVLTHPEWWQEYVMSPNEKVKKCIEGRSVNTYKFYLKTLEKHNRENIDW